MSKLNFVLCVIVLPIAVFSIRAQPGHRHGTAAVSGLVTLKGEPARGVTVLLLEQDLRSGGARQARTDEKGRFIFEYIAAGKYWISARAPGYISQVGDGLGRDGQLLDVSEGGKIENVSLEIKRGGVIAGRITNSQGEPEPERGVALLKFDRDSQPQHFSFFTDGMSDMFRTDDRGFYRIFGLPEGRYLVGVVSSRVLYPNVTSVAEAGVIEVTEGSEAANIDITLPGPRARRGGNR
jgi:Carboxypeptidase regulatory-like domain